MSKVIPIKDAEAFFASLKKAIERETPKIIFNGANVGAAEFQFRLFNEGKAADLSVMRYRSKQYKMIRERNGLQTAYKDLIFTGDLFNSLKVVRENEMNVAYGFVSQKEGLIAGYQEEQVGKPIFNLAKKEADLVLRSMDADVVRLIERSIEAYPSTASLATPQTMNKPVAKKGSKKSLKKSISKVRKTARKSSRKTRKKK